MIKCNKKMSKLIEKVNNQKRKPKHDLINLIEIMWPNFVEVDGCVLINLGNSNIEKLNIEGILNIYGDRTGFEASENHIHMSGCANEFYEHPLEGFKFALKLLEIWECKLRRDFPNYKFHIILSHDGKGSVLRFHKYREEDGAYLTIDDLEGYKGEGVLVKELG